MGISPSLGLFPKEKMDDQPTERRHCVLLLLLLMFGTGLPNSILIPLGQ